jgi:tetrahydromethanopterin S-methyltransferase subunit G
MRMPSAGDLEAVHKRLDALERRLDQIVDQLEAQSPKAALKRAPKP